MEEWKDVPGYEGRYQASSLGRVRSLKYGEKKILNFLKTRKYYQVALYNNGIRKQYLVHRLVAGCFKGLDISNSNILTCHKDDNPLNNREDNLFLGTHQDNTQDMILKGRRRGGKKIKTTLQYLQNGILINTFISTIEASKSLGILKSAIQACARGKTKTAGGFIWKYK